jgi:hypothetical protein
MLTRKHACTPRLSVFDSTKRDTVHDLLDLTEDRLDPCQFLEENQQRDQQAAELLAGMIANDSL